MKEAIKKHPVLPQAEIRVLIKKAQFGCKVSKDKVVLHNLGLVGKQVSKWVKTHKKMEYDDLFNEGVFGLMKAIDKFDLDRGVAFSTYAMPWIFQAISRAYKNKADTIRLPVHRYDAGESPTMVLSIDGYETEDGLTLLDFLIGDEDIEHSPAVDKYLSKVSPSYKEVVVLRYGLDNGKPRTLKEVADILGISSERVRQIQQRSLEQMRA